MIQIWDFGGLASVEPGKPTGEKVDLESFQL